MMNNTNEIIEKKLKPIGCSSYMMIDRMKMHFIKSNNQFCILINLIEKTTYINQKCFFKM